MALNQIMQLLAFIALAFTVATFTHRLRQFRALARPGERSTPKGKPGYGILYAFTLGMAPWAKESTRRHWLAYLRGVAFHLGIFIGLGIFLISPWMPALPNDTKDWLCIVLGIGALLGLAGMVARFIEPNLRHLSTRDDYIASLIVCSFLAISSLWLAGMVGMPIYYLTASAMLVYAPFGKIRHCLYYGYSRLFFGRYFGIRSVLPHGHPNGLS